MAIRTVVEPVEAGLARQRPVFDALSLLTPYDLVGERKIRIGAPGDGSYVFVDRLRPSQPVMSFGVGPSVNFEFGMAARGHQVLLFDHTIDTLPQSHPAFTWHREGVAAADDEAASMFTLARHMAKLPGNCDAPILKLDVESHEWSIFGSVAPDVLLRFEQISLEMHELERLAEPDFNAAVQRALRNLNAGFTLCHVHANNFGAIRVIEGFPVPEAIEATYVRTDLVARCASTTFYPTPLDAPNYHYWPELRLWFYPFIPGSAAQRWPTS